MNESRIWLQKPNSTGWGKVATLKRARHTYTCAPIISNNISISDGEGGRTVCSAHFLVLAVCCYRPVDEHLP